MNRVKIVATIGPASVEPDCLARLVEAGMDVARLNGSHADLDWHRAAIRALRAVAPDIPILLDIPGRKIRTRTLIVEPAFEAGDEVTLTTGDHPGEGDGRDGRVGVNRADLHERLRPGETILADDGTLRFTVLRIDGRDIVCRAETGGRLRSAKGINVPSIRYDGPDLTERDRLMLDFARSQGVDFVGISFVDGAGLVTAVQELLGPGGPRVVAKVENGPAMANLDAVVAAADAVMIDRGDLSVETNLEGIALAQKLILRVATGRGTPVIVATEMLHSMIEQPVPTKAEVTDISNAILDGADAIMLSGETAVGRYPVESVATMRRIADTVAGSVVAAAAPADRDDVPAAMGEAVALLAATLPVTKIVAITRSGFAARIVSGGRPRQPIIVATDDPATARGANLLFGCRGVVVPVAFRRTSTDHIAAALEMLWCRGDLTDDDLVLVTAVGYPRSGTRMNLIETHAIADLAVSLGWRRSSGSPARAVPRGGLPNEGHAAV